MTKTFKNSTARIEKKIAELAAHEVYDWQAHADLGRVHAQVMRYLAKWVKYAEGDRDIMEAVAQLYRDEAQRISQSPQEVIQI